VHMSEGMYWYAVSRPRGARGQNLKHFQVGHTYHGFRARGPMRRLSCCLHYTPTRNCLLLPSLLPCTPCPQRIAYKTNKYKYGILMYLIYMYIYIYVYNVRRHRLAAPPGGIKPPFASLLRLAAQPGGHVYI
jgi:hypothetical protein